MALRISVLRFDRLTPSLDDIDEVALEAAHRTVDVRQLTACANLSEELVRAVEVLQCLPVPALSTVQLRPLAKRLRQDQRILSRFRQLDRAGEMDVGLD